LLARMHQWMNLKQISGVNKVQISGLDRRAYY
jgi:hypothetical protein